MASTRDEAVCFGNWQLGSATCRRLGLLQTTVGVAVETTRSHARRPRRFWPWLALGLACGASLARAQQALAPLPVPQEPAPAETAASASGLEPEQVAQGTLLYRSPLGDALQNAPLERTDVQLDVRGLVVAAQVTQRFHNPTATPIEALYVFPLPHDAAVYDLEARVGERLIRAQVQEREQAQRTYAAARDEGRRAALLEQERPNIFTTSLANVLPGERVEVRLRYVGPLAWEGGRARLTFPLVVGPRYIPGTHAVGHQGSGWSFDSDAVPDASRITPPVRAPGTRPGHGVTLSVDLDAGVELEALASPSHSLRALPQAGGRVRLELAGGPVLPNRDFVLEFVPRVGAQPKPVLFLSAPGEQTQGSRRHFMLTAFPPPRPAVEERTPLETVFLVDVSGSMAGTSIEQARQTLQQALERLTPADRFHLVVYNHGFRQLTPAPLPADAENLARARRLVQGLSADGGTELLPALQAVLALPPPGQHLRHIVLITDGCLGNEEQVFAALRAGLGQARLFVVAIGSAPNHHLAANMAQFGRGSFTHVAEGGELRRQVGRLLDQIASPVLTDIRLQFEGLRAEDVLPARVPDLFRGQPLQVYGVLVGDRPGKLTIAGRVGQEPWHAELPVEPQEARFHAGLVTLWARAKADELLDVWRAASGAEQEQARLELVDLALRHRLVTRFTSLVAVEEQPAHSQGPPAPSTVAGELPAGWQMERVFGSHPQGGSADLFFETLGWMGLLAGGLLWLALRQLGVRA